MWWRASTLLVLGGCAQLLGLEVTSESTPDARRVDAPATGSDALSCVGGDTRAVDPATGACYMFFAAPMTRDAARTTCQGFGARLASIQSTTESTLIVGLLGASEALIGASDEAVESRFVWDDGTAVQLTNWNMGEPNNGLGMFEEDCVIMNGSLAGVWDDRPCGPSPLNAGAYPFVCERN